MCGCIVALAAFISPRLAIFFIWLFTDRMSIAFDSFWWGLLGFILLPWTTLAWAIAYAPARGVTGFGCEAGGDAIRFVQEKEGLGFPEAVETLAALGLNTCPLPKSQ